MASEKGSDSPSSPAAPALGEVLLVEDEAIVRKSIARQLRHLGLRVTAVGSAEEALGALADPPPTLVLTDLAMPGMDGVSLAARLRQLRPSLPIILMSGLVPEELQPQLAALKVLQLDKPFGENELKEALVRAAVL